ncbi:hypothetical protein MHBO_003245, partial [Bonamia ostreae]
MIPQLNVRQKMSVFSVFACCQYFKKFEGEQLEIMKHIINPILNDPRFFVNINKKLSENISTLINCEITSQNKSSDDFKIEFFKMLEKCIGIIEGILNLKQKIVNCALLAQKSTNTTLSINGSIIIGKLIATHNANENLVLDLFKNLLKYSDPKDIDKIQSVFTYILKVPGKIDIMD